MGLNELIDASRRYGADENFVLAGGGNTSYKDEQTLYIKASGTTLADITEEGMVRMSRPLLDAIWKQRYSTDSDERERQALADLMAARLNGETKRPSVETLLHELLRQQYVIHLHPSLVNGMTCGREGKSVASELYPNGMLWIPIVNPGYVLANHIRESIESHLAAGGEYPSILLLQNHGVFVASDSLEEIDRIYSDMMGRLTKRLVRKPDMNPDATSASDLAPIGEKLERAFADIGIEQVQLTTLTYAEIVRAVESKDTFAAFESFGYTPDHLVYCKPAPLWVAAEEAEDDDAVEELVRRYLEEHLVAPRIVAVEKTGAVAIGDSAQTASTAGALFLDLVKLVAYAESFGGPQLMPKDKIDFILNWEVESYRAKVGTGEE